MMEQPGLFEEDPSAVDQYAVDITRKRKPVDAEVVATVVVNKDRVLLIRRDIPGVDSHWLFPAGKIEPGESVFDAAAREVMEETGVYCRPVKIVSKRVHPSNNLKFAYVLCEYVNQAARPRREFRTKWFKANYIPKLLGGRMTKSVASAVCEIRRTHGVNGLRRRPNARRLPLLAP